MKPVTTFGTVTIEVNWEMWCALGMKGQDWLRSIAGKGSRLPDGGYRIELADYRLPEFLAYCNQAGVTTWEG